MKKIRKLQVHYILVRLFISFVAAMLLSMLVIQIHASPPLTKNIIEQVSPTTQSLEHLLKGFKSDSKSVVFLN